MPTSPPTLDPLRDQLAAALGAQYEVLVPIGRGAMGVVYLARERFLDRLVAVKVLPADLASSVDARERFLREARTAARLTHPHIVPLHSFGEAGDSLFYVMGYVDGESLEARLRREGRLAPDEAARMLAELADALHYAHSLGVVHRDLKPDNILIDRATGRAMLTDFGIAKRFAEGGTLTGTGIIVGTPHYMSPEQAAGDRDLDGRSDLYALGVIGYRMLAGRLPFDSGTVHEVLTAHVTREPAPIIDPAVPMPLVAVVMRALAKSPGARWPNGRAMRAALGESDGEDEDDALPDDLRGATGMAVRAFGFAAVIAQLGVANAISGLGDRDITVMLLACAVGTPMAMLGLQAPQVVKKMGWRDTVRLSLRQPRWWTGWWPTAYRRIGDVWDRLPPVIRRMRSVDKGSFPFLLVSLNLMAWMMSKGTAFAGWGEWAFWATVLGPFPVIMYYGVAAQRFKRARGLSGMELQRLIAEPTFGSKFWRRPEISALLGRASWVRADPSGPRSPADQLRAIEALFRGAEPDHVELIDEGVRAARELDAAINACDKELAELALDVAPEERARIEASIAALGAANTTESDAKQRMRALLSDQLVLLRGLEERRAEMMARRERLAGHMHALWLQLATLRAQAALDAVHASEITGRIRDIRREVHRRAAAAAEVQALTPPPGQQAVVTDLPTTFP